MSKRPAQRVERIHLATTLNRRDAMTETACGRFVHMTLASRRHSEIDCKACLAARPAKPRTADKIKRGPRIKRSEIGNFAMTAGNEKKFTRIICDGRVREWVGIGWVDAGVPTEADRAKLPTVID